MIRTMLHPRRAPNQYGQQFHMPMIRVADAPKTVSVTFGHNGGNYSGQHSIEQTPERIYVDVPGRTGEYDKPLDVFDPNPRQAMARGPITDGMVIRTHYFVYEDKDSFYFVKDNKTLLAKGGSTHTLTVSLRKSDVGKKHPPLTKLLVDKGLVRIVESGVESN